MTVAVAIPTIPPRGPLLARALRSVSAQTLTPVGVSIAYDHAKEGAGPTRNRALAATPDAEWVAFLDDDDELYIAHLDRLVAHAADTGADLVYPWFDVINGEDPFADAPWHRQPWDPAEPHIFPITVLVRRDLALTALAEGEGFRVNTRTEGDWWGDDWPFWCDLIGLGATIAYLDETTWAWHHDSHNTSGSPNRW